SARATRQAIFENSWNRTERGGAHDTRQIVLRLVQLRTEKAKLLDCPNFAAWKLEDQMARKPEAAKGFLDDLVLPAKANAARQAEDIRQLMNGETELQP